VSTSTYDQTVEKFKTLGVDVLATFAAEQAVLLGKDESWNGGDVCEAVASDVNDLLRRVGLPRCSDQSEEGYDWWRSAAEHLGWDHDGPEEDEYDDEEEED
jgi:hypothetical protein